MSQQNVAEEGRGMLMVRSKWTKGKTALSAIITSIFLLLFLYLFAALFFSIHLPLSGSGIHLECCELFLSVGNCGIFVLRAFKSPVIADQPRPRYSPETEMVAMVMPTVTAARNNAHRRGKREHRSG